MAGLLLPNTHTHVLIAAAIAHFNGGYFQQNIPPGWITVDAEDRLKVEKRMIVQALGRPCSDELWQSLLVKPQGQVVTHSDDLIVIE
ncbi:MAG: hypothetical protein KJ077_07015 [Anaerolineae bacterium]|nr:hypothetical protein [Anaerolineae bacterium]